MAKRVAVTQVLVVRLLVLAKRVAVTQVLVVRFLSWQNAGGDAGACGKASCLGKTRGGDAGACGKASCLGKTRGGDAGACGKVFVLAKRVAVMAVTQVLVVRLLSWQSAWR